MIDIPLKSRYFPQVMNPEKQLYTRARQALKLTFKKKFLLESALSHPSFRNENPRIPGLADFDRLEFFGDTILNFVICRRLYEKFPLADEGELSKLRSILVSRKMLFLLAKKTKISKLVRISKSLKGIPERDKAKIFADTFEAFIAALYFDNGLPAAVRWLGKIFAPYFDARRLYRVDPNPKSTLQEVTLKEWRELPKYRLEQGPEGFKTVVSAGPKLKAEAVGRSRQESEEKAAGLLLRLIREKTAQRLKTSRRASAHLKRASSRKKRRKTR